MTAPTWPTMAEGAAAAKDRARGRCERCGHAEMWGMTSRLVVHHVAGRGFPECHHPALLLVLHDDCHRAIHGSPGRSYVDGSMIRRNGVQLAEALATITEDPADHRPIGYRMLAGVES